MNIRDIMRAAPVMPVLVIDDAQSAVPLARALVAGGLRVLEITLRTEAAFEAIAAIRAEVPDAIVGAGTVLRRAQVERCRELGVAFAVSPGLTPGLAAAARGEGVALLPGVMTPSEVMAAREDGFDAMKLFPAEQAGGVGMLKALGGPLPEVLFCPTGGVTLQSAPSYLALPNVGCVGGSWLAPRDLVKAGDWLTITALATAAAGLRPA
jgi:2-dehydro-3-deoxyphosphogluconate aldolase/(4S)-4-hydroxy-2-oxoglutarate aldolase